MGNTGGFLFRAATALQVGGFYPEDNPSADYWFYLRFMLVGQLRQHLARCVVIRRTEGRRSAYGELEADERIAAARFDAALLFGAMAMAMAVGTVMQRLFG